MDEQPDPAGASAACGSTRSCASWSPRAEDVLDVEDRLRRLLDAVVSVASDLDLPDTLRRIVELAVRPGRRRVRRARRHRRRRHAQPSSSPPASTTSCAGRIGDLPHGPRHPRRADPRPAPAAARRPRPSTRRRTASRRTTRRCTTFLGRARPGPRTRCSATSTSPRSAAAASSPSATRTSWSRSRPRPASRSRTPGCTRRRAGASGGSRPPPRSPPACCPAPTAPRSLPARRRRGPAELADADIAVAAAPTAGQRRTRRSRAVHGSAEDQAGSSTAGRRVARRAAGGGAGRAVADLLEATAARSSPRRPGPRCSAAGGPRSRPAGRPRRRAGVLAVARRGPATTPSRTTTAALLRSFAGQAALALELAARRRTGEQLAVLEDRDRIARDLHDLVIQRLFAAGMACRGARRGSARTAPASGSSPRRRPRRDDPGHPADDLRAAGAGDRVRPACAARPCAW